MKKLSMKLLAGASALVLLGSGLAIGANVFPKEVVKEVTKEVPGPTQTVEVIKEVSVEKLVEVESPHLPLLLETLYDFDGQVEFLTEDLDKEQIGDIVDRLVFIQDSKSLAFAEIKRDGTEQLDGEVVGETTLYEEDIKSFSIVDDEWAVVSSDFEDGELELSVPVRFKQGAEHFEALLQVRVKDGDAKDIDVLSVELRE